MRNNTRKMFALRKIEMKLKQKCVRNRRRRCQWRWRRDSQPARTHWMRENGNTTTTSVKHIKVKRGKYFFFFSNLTSIHSCCFRFAYTHDSPLCSVAQCQDNNNNTSATRPNEASAVPTFRNECRGRCSRCHEHMQHCISFLLVERNSGRCNSSGQFPFPCFTPRSCGSHQVSSAHFHFYSPLRFRIFAAHTLTPLSQFKTFKNSNEYAFCR